MFLRKKAQPFIIKIHQPCGEDWHKMTPVEQGRHCAVCQKNLVDFSVFSDEEIIARIQKSNGPVCGRFLNTQLNRALEQPEAHTRLFYISPLKKLAASFIMLYSLLNQAQAQQKTAVTTAQTSHPATAKKAAQPTDTAAIIIHVKVLNYHNSEPLKMLGFKIEGTECKATTNSYGRFKIVLPKDFTGSSLIITPDDSTKAFLESTGSIIPDDTLFIDSLPYSTTITMYRYPVDKASSTVAVTSTYSKGLVDAGAPFCPVDRTIPPPEKTAEPKKSVAAKIRDFFKIKKSKTNS